MQKCIPVLRVLPVVVSLVWGIAAAQQARQQPPPPQTTPGTPAPLSAESPKVSPGSAIDATAAVPGVDPKTFQIGPGDALYIDVWREQSYSRPVFVRPDGKITLPVVGDLQAEGLTPDRLGGQIKEALGDLIVNPIVTVTVTQVNSKTYTVEGEVNRAGRYPLVGPTKISDALNSAAGFRDFANKKDILIIRGNQRLHFNWNDYVKGKKLEQNILLQNNDEIHVR